MNDRDQGAFEAALQADLAAARQQNLVLADQLRAAEARNEAMAHRVDFLTAEVARVTASREQYERVAIRVSAKMEAATSMMMGQLAELQDEIRSAAFTLPPGTAPNVPATPAEPEKQSSEFLPAVADIETLSRSFIAGFHSSSSLLPPPRLGNGAVK
jgi:seryl-tRNA synthetase